MKKARESSISILKERKADFFNKIDSSTKEYLSNLTEAIKDKETQTELLRKGINILNNMNQ